MVWSATVMRMAVTVWAPRRVRAGWPAADWSTARVWARQTRRRRSVRCWSGPDAPVSAIGCELIFLLPAFSHGVERLGAAEVATAGDGQGGPHSDCPGAYTAWLWTV